MTSIDAEKEEDGMTKLNFETFFFMQRCTLGTNWWQIVMDMSVQEYCVPR